MPIGKGIMVWDLQSTRIKKRGLSMSGLADVCAELGMNWVSIKMTDGVSLYNRRRTPVGTYVDDLLPGFVDALRRLDISVWGWGFSYGGYWSAAPKGLTKKELKKYVQKQNGKVCYSQGAAEGIAALKRIQQFSVDGWMIDAENTSGDAWRIGGIGKQSIIDHIKAIRSGVPANFPIASNTYRMPSKHPYMPWEQIIGLTNIAMPQVYWVGEQNSELQVSKSFNEYRSRSLQPFVPTGVCSAPTEWAPWAPSINSIEKFFDQSLILGCPGITYWALDEVGGPLENQRIFDALKVQVWPGTTPVDPPEEPEPPSVPLTLESLDARIKAIETKLGLL